MEDQLTGEEIETLMDALKAWEAKDGLGEIAGELMEQILIPKDAPEDIRQKFKLERERRKEQYKREQAARRETSVLLQAKLIKLRPPITEIVRPLR